MSGRWIVGKPVALATGCAVLGVAAIIAYAAMNDRAPPASATLLPSVPGCIALAIDRETGTTSAVPCAGTQMLLADQSGRGK